MPPASAPHGPGWPGCLGRLGGLGTVALAASALLLAGCTVVIGPTVSVQPPPGKPPVAFQADHAACMASTTAQVQPVADRRTSGTAALQDMFNTAYGSCMAARGNVVPASAPARATVAGGGRGGRSDRDGRAGGRGGAGGGTGALQDPDSVAARQSLAELVDGFRRSCEGEPVAVTVTVATVSPAATARLVELTTPGGGNCFGQPGRNSYLVAKVGGGWQRLLAAEPGAITALGSRHNGYADLELSSLGACTYSYRWTGSRYAQAGSHDCGTAAPPTLGTLSRAARGR